MKRTVITIGRQTGSGGREIGIKVAEALNIPYYDKEIIQRASEETELSPEFIEKHDEKRSSSLLYSLVMDNAFSINSNLPSSDQVFLAQFNAIKNVAKEGSCVIVGRCADYALEDDPDLISIFIYADYDFRKDRIKLELDTDNDTEAKSYINKTDKTRAGYYNYYSGKKWGDASGYHLAIDSSKFGVDTCVNIICDIVKEKHNA